ncbi:hypothetical protein [Polaribacter tangerinus]|uniref:hypothetical protein n=1 Tax=Polaribacter tangerinus TaxID=1920034 RepID=UPI000B4BC4C1|nr:hypothetical protein [Polaribacter tangerinus]
MITDFKTDIVNTKSYKSKYSIPFGLFYIASCFYLLFIPSENQILTLKIISLIVILLSAYFLFEVSFIKPKVIGMLKINEKQITISSKETVTITVDELDHIYLKYSDYGSWKTHSIYGNKNYLKITSKNGKKYQLEILIRNEKEKNKLKRITDYFSKKDQFSMTNINNPKTKF